MQNITVTNIAQALNTAKQTTQLINVQYTSTIKTAAAHKHLNVVKVVNANVQAFNSETAYSTAIKNSAKKLNVSAVNTQNAQSFTKSKAHFTHTNNNNCYAIVYNANKDMHYLYVRFIKVLSTTYLINGVATTKQAVANLLTNSAKTALLNKDNTVHNVTNDVTHNVQLRTIGFKSLNSVTINKQVFTNTANTLAA